MEQNTEAVDPLTPKQIAKLHRVAFWMRQDVRTTGIIFLAAVNDMAADPTRLHLDNLMEILRDVIDESERMKYTANTLDRAEAAFMDLAENN